MADDYSLEKELKFSFGKTCKLIYRYARKRVIEQIKVVSVIIPYLIIFQRIVLGIPLANSAIIAIGLVFVLAGLTFFMEGILLGLMPLGQTIGVKLPQKAKLPLIVFFAFVLGVGVTFAEPAIGALRLAGSRVIAWEAPLLFLLLNRYADYLIYAVGTGVGVAVLFGVLRFIYGWSLKPFIYLLVVTLAFLSLYAHFNPNLYYLLGLAWDCGAVTTGPVTVPLIIALGVGVSRAIGSKPSESGSFGIVSLASLFPIIAVMLIGLFNYSSVPKPMSAEEFFQSENRKKAAVLFSSQDEYKAYALKNTGYQIYSQLFEGNQEIKGQIEKISDDNALIQRVFGNQENFWNWRQEKEKSLRQVESLGLEEKRESEFDFYQVPEKNFAAFDFFGFLKRNFQAAARAILPLSFFLIFVLLVLLREKLPRSDEVILGLLFALIGMAVFRGGIEVGLSSIGDQVGKNLPAAYTKVDIPYEEKTIINLSPDSIQSAITLDGEKKKFFYLEEGETYKPVPFEEVNYQSESQIYRHIPSRGPLFGRGEKSLIGILVVLLFVFIMGYGATLAEPGLNALGIAVEETTVGTVKKSFLIQAVAVGVGFGTSAGISKIIWDLPLVWMLLPTYILLLFLTKFSDEEFVDISWDSAGVTTGPVTVPLVLAMGLSIGSQSGVVEGFGMLALASAGPILSVLLAGSYVRLKRKATLKEAFEGKVEYSETVKKNEK